MPDLHPSLLAALSAVDRGDVCLSLVGPGQARRWLVAGRPDTPAVQSLLDAGLVDEDHACDPPLAVTGKGRAVLDNLNPPEPSDEDR